MIIPVLPASTWIEGMAVALPYLGAIVSVVGLLACVWSMRDAQRLLRKRRKSAISEG
jgi:hypothetical protein